jgi:uncharacterized damage-inducible protein DinB
MLAEWLDIQRQTVVMKVDGLDESQATRQLVGSPLTTCAGIVRHLRYVERWWFREILEGEELPAPEPVGDHDGQFRVLPGMLLANLVADYTAECDLSRQVFERWELDAMSKSPRRTVSCRWVMVHMIEETARHNGQLDILRELLDGRTGY